MRTAIRAAVLNEAPGKLDVEVLYIDEPAPQEVLIKVDYAGLCHSDLHEIDGTFETSVPIVLGHEIVGDVVAVGAATHGVSVGDRVIACLSMFCGSCAYCLKGRQTLCVNRGRLQQERDRPRLVNVQGDPVRPTAGIGGFAQMALVHHSGVVVVPSDIRPATASVLGCAVATGLGAVLHSARVRAGESVAIIGLGGIGFAAVQAARLVGASRVIGVDVVPSKLAMATRFGATDVVNAADGDPVAAVRELTNGGVDHAFEAVGSGKTVSQAFAMLRPGGTATVMGMVPDDHQIDIRGSELYMQEKQLQGSFMGSNHFKVDIPMYAEFDRLGELQLDDLVTAEFDLDTINDGFAALASGDQIRVVARISEVLA